ncbi:hypothetical protein [Streptomyces stelliscabiei]|uniref:hypothetical protein n=1 Tax=Streptomyces stelliscabiei TaxID=146820 RepID=UPI002FF2A098
MSARDQAFTEGARLLEDAACDADWGKTPDFCAGLRAGAELLLANTGEKATDQATATPDFFQPGHTYRLGARHTFRCTAIDSNPGTGERHAIGWAYDTHTGRWRVTDLNDASWRGGWVDVTEAGDGRG